MRDKSVENFKTKIPEITKRSHNLDDDLIVQVNRILRGTANFSLLPSHATNACSKGSTNGFGFVWAQ
uniref:Uncharacterized protein n=1 Tax=Candidatus Kentrum sp. TC TaxID=2126339 RepID=A0A450ZA92_9GAMM|nr:MAG: hypothetical protein BECKTC1821D_GA0114238_11106 [Candidatus Kentron sp. TC]